MEPRRERLFTGEWAAARAVWAQTDPVLHAAAPTAPVERPLDPMPTHFSALATAITHQQVSLAAGRSIARRTVAACGGSWDAATLARRSDDELRAAGLSRAKVRYLRALAAADLAGELHGLEHATDDEAIQRLVRLPGIGTWTARMFLLLHLRRPDIFSGEDFGLREGIRLLDSLPAQPSIREADARAAVWSPYRSVASLVLWDLVRRTRQAR